MIGIDVVAGGIDIFDIVVFDVVAGGIDVFDVVDGDGLIGIDVVVGGIDVFDDVDDDGLIGIDVVAGGIDIFDIVIFDVVLDDDVVVGVGEAPLHCPTARWRLTPSGDLHSTPQVQATPPTVAARAGVHASSLCCFLACS